MKQFTITAAIWLALCASAFAEIKRFDKELSPSDSWIIIAPPEGKTWTIELAAFHFAEPVPGTGVTVWLEDMPYNTGLCTNIIRADAGQYEWIPIVGGFIKQPGRPDLEALYGNPQPIEIRYPSRLVIAVEGLRMNHFIRSWVRAEIEETSSRITE